MFKRAISRAEIAAQCTRHSTALAFRSPLTLFLFSITTILISCYATLTLMSCFQSSFCCNHFYCIFVCPHNLLFQPTFFSLCLCAKPSIIFFSPCHLANLYMVIDCSCIVYSIQPPTKVSLLKFSFAFASLLSCSWL
jgi:hypothetical protein